MANKKDKEEFHTFLDDIKYQMVKEKNKRSSFSSNDHQIIIKSQQIIRDIEKDEKLIFSELRHQQALMLSKLNRLQQTKRFLGTRSDILTNRRYSEPVGLEVNSEFFKFVASKVEHQCPQKGKDSLKFGPQTTLKTTDKNKNMAHGSIHDKRRHSHEIMTETLQISLAKFDKIMSGTLRRATISEGASSMDCFPSSDALVQQSQLAGKTSDTDEDNDQCFL